MSAKARVFRWRRRALALAAVQLGSASALAAPDGETLKVRVGTTLGSDSNVFRLPPEVPPAAIIGSSSRSDVIKVLSLGANVDWNLGRQRLLIDASAAENRYSRFTFLDHRSSDLRGNFLWEVGNDFSGDLGYSRAESLTSFGDFRLPVKNLQTVERTSGTALYRLYPRVRLRGGLGRTTLTNPTRARRFNDREDDAYEAGLQYTSPTNNVIGLLVRRTEGGPTQPQPVVGAPVSVEYTQTDAEVTMDWQVTGISKVVGSVGYTSRKNDDLAVRNFSGPSAHLRYDWQRGKLLLTTGIRRDLGAYEDTETNYVLTDAISVGATWVAAAKVTLRATAEHRAREFLGDPGFLAVPGSERKDKLNIFSASVSYAPLRSVQASLSVSHETRSSNRAFLDFRATSAFASLQFVF